MIVTLHLQCNTGYRQHTQKFRIELSSQFSPNLFKLIFFDFHVWQQSALIQNVQNPSNIHSHDISERSNSLERESCEVMLLEVTPDLPPQRLSQSCFDQSCFECPEVRVPFLVVILNL